MSEQKENALALGKQEGVGSGGVENGSYMSASADSSIAQSAGNVKGKPQKKARKKRTRGERRLLTMESSTFSLAIKCYHEHLPDGLDATKKAVENLDKTKYHAVGIEHDRCLNNDGVWAPSTEKPHIHIDIRGANRDVRFRVKSMLEALHIRFRPGIDDILLENRAIETIGDFGDAVLYLTHETKQAILDAKTLYDASELFMNLTPDEYKEVREGYVRLNENRKLQQSELVALDKEAFDLGYELKDFDEWYDNLPFVVRKNASMRVIRESYGRGVDKRIAENSEVLRLCIFIEGGKNLGKSYAALAALAGKKILVVQGGGSGKFDKLTPSTDAIVVNDDVVPYLLTMTDNFVCRAYRRNRDNPVWSGQYFIVTSNLAFVEWCESCGLRMREYDYHGNWRYTEHARAIMSRFFICRIKTDANGVSRLALTTASSRGTANEQIARTDMFVDFQRQYNATIAQYVPRNNLIDYSLITEPLDAEEKLKLDQKKEDLREWRYNDARYR